MASYSFGDASAAAGPYDSSRAYRRDSGISGTCDYQHPGASAGDAAAGMSTGEEAFADYLFRQQGPTSSSSDISSVVAAVAAVAQTSSVSCGATGISMFQESPHLHSSSGYAQRSSFGSYSAQRYQEGVISDNQSPSAAAAVLTSGGTIPAAASLTSTSSPNSVALGPLDTLGSTPSSTSSVSTSCLADPLPSFLSSLPTPMESSKYSSLVAGIASANNSAAILANAAPTGAGPNAAGHSLLAAAAAAAAAAVVSSASATPVGAMASSGNPSSMSHANTPAGSYSHYSAPHQHSHNHSYTAHSHAHQYSAAAHNNAYDVSALGLSHNSGISASTPSLSAQVVAAAALAQGAGSAAGHATSALDLHSYSISAFSRPLSQSSPTSAAMISSDATAPAVAGNNSSFAGISQALTQQSTQHSQPPYHQQRSYSDYSAYYRSPSATMGLGTGSTTATGASPTSGTGMNAAASAGASTNNPTQLAAAAAAAAAAMGTGYYASAAAYQPYMRTSVGGGSNTYYYAQPQSRYLPYSAYPPIRHFVSPARPFKCETCDQSFSRNHDLKRHVKIHSGVKPHKCPKCGKSFGRSDALKRHSMVKRCRSSTSSASVTKSSPPPSAQPSAQGMSVQRIPQVGSQRFDSATSRMPMHPQLHHVQQAHSLMQQGIVGSSGAAMPSVPSSSRLAPVSSSLFGQGGGGNASAMAMSASTNSIVSSMLSSRTNTI